jgi:hypothetical protein
MTVGGKTQEVSVFAATQLAFPGLLLFLSAVFLVAGFGVHISGALWTFGVGLVLGAGGYGSVASGKLAAVATVANRDLLSLSAKTRISQLGSQQIDHHL